MTDTRLLILQGRRQISRMVRLLGDNPDATSQVAYWKAALAGSDDDLLKAMVEFGRALESARHRPGWGKIQ